MASLNVALPDIARDTHATQTQLSWVIDAYSLVFAALLLPGGALGDRYGRRVALIAGLVIFGAGSAVAMTASSATELIALRAILGLGAALVMPATLSTITGTFPPAERAQAVSIWAGVAGGAAVLGVLASGALLRGLLAGGRSSASTSSSRSSRSPARCRSSPNPPTRRPAPRHRRRDPRGRRPGRARVLRHRGAYRRVAAAPHPGRARPRPCSSWSAFVAFELRQATRMLDPRVFTRRGLTAGTIVDPRPVLRVLRVHLPGPAVPADRPQRPRRSPPR